MSTSSAVERGRTQHRSASFAWIALAALSLAQAARADPPPSPPKAADEAPASAADALAYSRAGRELLERLGPLRAALQARGSSALRSLLAPDPSAATAGIAWAQQASPAGVHVELGSPAPGKSLGSGAEGTLALVRELRAPFASFERVELKLDVIGAVRAEDVDVRLNLEIEGEARLGGRAVTRANLTSRWVRRAGKLTLATLGLRYAERTRGPGTLFRQSAAAWGLRHFGSEDPRFRPPFNPLRYQVIRHAIGGATAADVDGDGRDDVLLTHGEGLSLFLNRGGRFEDVTRAWGLEKVRHPVVTLACDFDGDGDRDLFVGSFYGPNHLFENTGASFRDVTQGSGLAQDDMTAIAAAGDFDGDGRVDLYLGRFLDARDAVPLTMLYTRNGAPNKLYLARGKGLRFVDVSAESGADDRGLTLGAAAGDVDGDGDVDLYLSNDYGRNVFLRNDGRGRFHDASLETGTLAVSGGMSATLGDVNNDGQLDLYVSSIRSNQRWFSDDLNIRAYVLNIVRSKRRAQLQELFWDLRKHMGESWGRVGYASLKGNYLLRQRPDGTFADVSEVASANPRGWFWSSGFFDVDNDGFLDVFASNGWITGELKDDL